MKIRDFINVNADIDVCDDYDESCYIAFCGPMSLTKAGEKHFKKALDMEINSIEPEMAVLHAENNEEVDTLRDFFFSAAGYCSDADYKEWFGEEYLT